MITFAHTADIHFGMENYGRIDPETGIHSRLLDFQHALSFCIDTAIARNVDLFVFSGDAYKTATPTPTQQKLFLHQFLRLYQAKIPVIIIVGNHDHPMSFGKAHALDIFSELPLDGFHIFAKPQAITLETKNGPLQIVGIPWPTRHTLLAKTEMRFKNNAEIVQHLAASVGTIIASFAQQLDPNLPAILASHLTVSEGIFSGSEKTAVLGSDPILLPSQLAIEPFDYVALGHLHRFQDLNKKGRCPIVYAGSPERIDFGERSDTKGFCLVSISHDKKTSYEFITTPTRPMIQVDVDIAPGKDQTEQLLAALEQHDLHDAIVKVIYRLTPGAHDTINLGVLETALKDAWHVAGIIPIHQPKARERRADISVSMNETELLSTYLKSKDFSPDDIVRLLAKQEELLAGQSDNT